MARLDPNPYPLPPLHGGGDFRERIAAQQTEMEKLRAKSRALPPGDIVGAVLQWQRADGYAIYIVTNDRPLTVQHIDFMDGYTVEAALLRGLTKTDVLDMLDRDRRFAAIFSKGK